ncbi:hypothetical protein GCM10017687_38260 [Streptomyces echinatus]
MHARHYRAARTWLMASTFIGLIGFTLLPTLPAPPALGGPRLRGHDGPVQLVRLVVEARPAPARGMGGMTNQYAAMPSLHVGWASVVRCVMLWRDGGTRLTKVLGVLYPLVTALVVMAPPTTTSWTRSRASP